MSKETLKKCPECGKLFACFGDDDCWCEKLQIHKKDLLFIQEKYQDCLCPDCLGKFAE
jgi:hypothetical protein